jgi:enoyl-CoA hydratase/carnithine racemase
MFSGGLDMPNLINLDWNEMQRFARSVIAFHHQLAIGTVPVVAAITGHCAAAGTVSAALCDYRVMAKGDYKIGLNEARVGLCPGRIPYAVLRRLLGSRHAEQLVTRGEFLTPEQALQVGLVDRVVDPSRVVPEALDYAQGFTELPPRAFAETRRIAREDLVELFLSAKREDSEELRRRWFSDETQQGLRALAAKLKKSG